MNRASTGQPRVAGRFIERSLVTLALIVVIVAFGAPFLMTVAAALDGARLTNWPWPSEPTLSNFHVLFDQRGGGHALRNSIIVSVSTTLLAVPVCSLAGYGLSRMAFRGKSRLSVSILLLQSIPLSATMVPIYDLASRLHLRNSYLGMVLTHAAISLPLLVWLMKGFTDAVPITLEEAARVDGASWFRGWRDIVLPQTLAGLAIVAGFAFANAWAEVLMVVILVDNAAKETLPFQFFYVARSGGAAHVTAALGVLYVFPVLLVFLCLRRVMIRGLVEATAGI